MISSRICQNQGMRTSRLREQVVATGTVCLMTTDLSLTHIVTPESHTHTHTHTFSTCARSLCAHPHLTNAGDSAAAPLCFLAYMLATLNIHKIRSPKLAIRFLHKTMMSILGERILYKLSVAHLAEQHACNEPELNCCRIINIC